MDRIDLHTHSTFSDGTYTPTELIRYAKEKGLRAIALTDHDTTAGLHEAAVAAQEAGITFINGIELSTIFEGTEIHLLGLFIDPQSESLQNALRTMVDSRTGRNTQMLKKLDDIGILITERDLLNHTQTNVPTRAHFARAIVEKGYCGTLTEAFTKYLSPGRKAYVPRQTLTAAQTIDVIHRANGLAALAHPMLYKMGRAALENMVASLRHLRLDAIESLYATHTMADNLFLGRLAKKYRLKVTGGSDFHGENKTRIDIGVGRGRLFVPYTVLVELQQV